MAVKLPAMHGEYQFTNLMRALSALNEHASALGFSPNFNWHVVNGSYSLVGRFSRGASHVETRIANHPRGSADAVDAMRQILRLDANRYAPAIDIVFPAEGPTEGVHGFVDLDVQVAAARGVIDSRAI